LSSQEEAFENKSKMRRPLPGLPDVLAASTNKDDDRSKEADQPQPSQTIYRVIGGRKHVQKSEASMQTEPSLIKQPMEQHYDWKKAMAHNARVLSSQEKAMDEYLRRQRAAAEHHITQIQGEPALHLGGNEGMLSLQVKLNLMLLFTLNFQVSKSKLKIFPFYIRLKI
jgi:hypothetical protein